VTGTEHEARFTGGDVEKGEFKQASSEARRGKYRQTWRGIKAKEMAGFGYSGSNSGVRCEAALVCCYSCGRRFSPS
jgi:hypothetical protein